MGIIEEIDVLAYQSGAPFQFFSRILKPGFSLRAIDVDCSQALANLVFWKVGICRKIDESRFLCIQLLELLLVRPVHLFDPGAHVGGSLFYSRPDGTCEIRRQPECGVVVGDEQFYVDGWQMRKVTTSRALESTLEISVRATATGGFGVNQS